MPIHIPSLSLAGGNALERAHEAPVVRKVAPSATEDELGPIGGARWIGHSRFHDMNDSAVLGAVGAAVVEALEHGARPIVVFDLDSTLYDNDRRTLRIVREWAASVHADQFPAVSDELSATVLDEIGYSVADVFRSKGLDLTDPAVARAYQSAKAFWLERFFDGSYVAEDAPYPGAVEYARELFALGATVVYLTGREQETLGDATRAVLARDGFPIDRERTRLILKNGDELSDADFKRRAAAELGGVGEVVATFDNEPGNVMVFEDVFPRAVNVFVHTDCSEKPATPGRAVHYIRSFQRVG